MPLFPDLTLLVVFSVSLFVYLLLQFLNSRKGYREKKLYLLDQYKSLRSKSLALQQNLTYKVLSEEVEKDPIIDNMTSEEYLSYLKRNHVQYLSDKGYAKIKNSNNRIEHKRVAKILKAQEKKLKEAESKLSRFLPQGG